MMRHDSPNATFDEELESLRNQLERERRFTARLLHLAHASRDLHALMREVTLLLREWSGCEAVGIRLRNGDDFPYFETRGFPPDFVEAENALCTRDLDGQIARDFQGNPILECMCGNVLCGRFNPALPFFSSWGSFWTNGTTELLASTTEAERQARTRNRCNGEGYESVALIPLRTQDATLGLLQLNDRRPGRFTADFIVLLEGLAAALAEAVAGRTAADRLAQREHHFQLLYEQAPLAYHLLDEEGRVVEVNQRWLDLLGYARDEVIGRWLGDFVVPGARAVVGDRFAHPVPSEWAEGFDMEMVCKDGRVRTVRVDSTAARDGQGPTLQTHSILRDVTEQRKAENAQRIQAMVLDQIADCVTVTDPEGRIAYVNDAECRMFHRKREELLGQNVAVFGDTFLRGGTQREIVEQTLEKGAWHGEAVSYTPQGDAVVLDCRTHLVRGAAGETLALCSIATDVTEHHRAENALRESERRFRSLFDHAIAAIVLHEVQFDPDGAPVDLMHLEVNPAFERLTGLKAAEVLGRGITELFPREEADHLIAICGRVALTGESASFENASPTLNRTYAINAYSVSRGRVAIQFQDITEFKRAGQAMRDSETLLNRAEAIAGTGSFVWDLRTEAPMQWSKGLYALHGIDPGQPVGRSSDVIARFVHPEDRQHVRDQYARMVAARETWPIEFRIVRADGSERLFHSLSELVLDEQGVPLRLIGSHLDITRRRADENRLAAMQLQLNHTSRLATMGELAAGIAHELNQPLCAIVNYAKACRNLVAQPAPDLDQLRQWCDAIAHSAGRAGDIVRGLLHYARRSEPERKTVGIRQLIDDAILLVRHEAHARQVTIGLAIPDEELPVVVQPVRIQQVLVNLLRNAIEAMAETPFHPRQIDVHVTRQGGQIHVAVSDRGAGLSPESMQKMFEPFFTTKTHGLGLGLAISRTIVEEHEGTILATANPEGGLTVRFTLPAE